MIKLVAGLGNPGRKYELTRHNLGFITLDLIAERYESSFRSGKGEYRQSSVVIESKSILLIKPMTYMNLSGHAVADAARFRGFEPNEILVVCDDVNLPTGRIRIRSKGSDGGHNGLRSIIEQLGSDDFSRVRLGVGLPDNPDKPLEAYVLEKFAGDETDIVEEMIKSAADAVEMIISDGVETAQQKFN